MGPCSIHHPEAGLEYARRLKPLADEIGPDWNSDGIAADATLLFELGQKLANSREWPQWKAGAEFKAVRDATAAQRK